MNLLDTASLVVTPNGYKASKLYSIVPSDGSGDMTFARTGDTATRVNSSGLIETVLANKPRLDYTSSTCPKLLLEPQRTNLILKSQALADAEWATYAASGTITRTNNYAVSPDGTSNATRIQNSGGSNVQWTYQNIAHTTNVVTFWYKRTGSTDQTFRFFSNNATFHTSLTATSTWQKFTGNIAGSSTIPLGITSDASGNACDILIWGFQCEAGAYETSYIPTTTASVTRNQDQCYKTAISSLIGQTEGTMYWEGKLFADNQTKRIHMLSDGTDNNRIIVNMSSNQLQFIGVASGLVTFNIISPGKTTGIYKLACAYKLNDFAFYVNGVQIGSDTSGAVPICSRYDLGIDYTATYIETTNVFKTVLWKTRLTNQELVTLTTI